MEDFILDSEPKSLKTNSKCPAVLYADGTSRNHQQKILLTYEMSYPHAVLDMFVDCFTSLSKEIRAKMNGGLCSPLLDYIQNEPVRRLDFDCYMQDINRFKKQNIELGILCILRNKSRGDQKFSGQGTMTHNNGGSKQQRSL